MKQFIKKVERYNKKSTKFKFHLEPKQMTIETDDKWCPDQVLLVCQHRNKRFASRPRKLESSCTIACRRLVVWPESLSDPIEFETTIYSQNSTPNSYEDKIWTLVLEGSMTKLRGEKAKLKNRPLASTELNMKTLISQPGMKAEVNVVMRPLQEGIKFCRLEMFLITTNVTTSNDVSSLVQPDSTQVQNIHQQEIPTLYMPGVYQQSTNTQPSYAMHSSDFANSHPADYQFSPNAPNAYPQALIMQQPHQAAGYQFLGQPQQVIPTSTHAPQQLISTVSSVNVSIGMPVTSFSVPQNDLKISSAGGTLTSANANTITQVQPVKQKKLLTSVDPETRDSLKLGPDTKNATPVGSSTAFNEETKSTEVKTDFCRKVAERAANETDALQQNLHVPSSFVMKNNGVIHHELLEQLPQQQKTDSIPIIQKKEEGSDQETELIEHHHRLVGEKDQLSRRQDYLNVQLELNETEFKLLHLRNRLTTSVSPNERNLDNEGIEGEAILMNARRDSNNLLIEYRELMDLKDELTHKLSDLEEEKEEGIERSRLILEQTRNLKFEFSSWYSGTLECIKTINGLVEWNGTTF
ncbi:C2 NT-type domain-containing protein [Meloidogyne graminicola]|uniref:C2 NT-type domain-containing protein n=1 Tax=Meloidogyne graminicola TaxID=189291 RepID=A0A8S9ZZA1_9BILA|nr:C2 NT-type domain-containing protein [Meloidogyne graminicola]